VNYLLWAHDTATHTDSGHFETIAVDIMKHYKTRRSYQLHMTGHIHRMAFLPTGEEIVAL
jgi:hypothetical protein